VWGERTGVQAHKWKSSVDKSVVNLFEGLFPFGRSSEADGCDRRNGGVQEVDIRPGSPALAVRHCNECLDRGDHLLSRCSICRNCSSGGVLITSIVLSLQDDV
jgi:hypothetical protein